MHLFAPKLWRPQQLHDVILVKINAPGRPIISPWTLALSVVSFGTAVYYDTVCRQHVTVSRGSIHGSITCSAAVQCILRKLSTLVGAETRLVHF